MKIEGPFMFTTALPCKPEVLGKRYPARIGGIDVELVFPSVPMQETADGQQCVKKSNCLLPPDGKRFTIWGEDVDWGCPRQYPRANSFVKAILISFDCEDSDAEASSQKIYSAIEKWEDSLVRYCQLCTKHSFGHPVQHHKNAHQNLKLFSSNEYMPPQQTIYLQGTLYSEDCFISDEQMVQAIAFAASGKELLLEYQMLLSAYEARKKGQNRQAIVDACSAVEICVVNKIRDYCLQYKIRVEPYLRKHRSLGDRLHCIARFDSTFPIKDYDKIIVNPRNKVVHYNSAPPPTINDTNKLLAAAEQCLNHYRVGYC